MRTASVETAPLLHGMFSIVDAVRTDLERELHSALGLGADDHADRFADVGVSPYDPASRPEQRIDTFRTPVSDDVLAVSQNKLQDILKILDESGLGEVGRIIVEALTQAPPKGQGDVLSLVDNITEMVAQRKSVALLSPHADRLEDIGALSAGLAVAMGDATYIRRNGLILNKVMTRELYKGRPMVDMFTPFGNIYWVILGHRGGHALGSPSAHKGVRESECDANAAKRPSSRRGYHVCSDW